jgi:RNA-directed DNA polymerase
VTRPWGMPTVLDRGIEPALVPVLQEAWAPTCSASSDGVRPQRRAHPAGGQAQAAIRDGDTGVGDRDLDKVMDRVNPDVWLSRVRRRVKDRRVVTRIHRCLKAGVLPLEGRVAPTAEGPPHGGPHAPLLANWLRDELDQALERRGHRFARDAADANSSVRSQQTGGRVMARVRRWLERKRRRTVHEAKSAVDRPGNRQFFGCTGTKRQATRRQVSAKALQTVQAKVRELTRRTRGRTMRQSVPERRPRIRGWRAFFGLAEGRAPRRDLDKWIRRRRSAHWKPWGRRGDRERRKRGVSRQLAGNTVKSAHGPWRLRQRPALAIALPQHSCAALGLPSLSED